MNEIIQLNNINPIEFDILFSMLEQITIPKYSLVYFGTSF